MQFVEPPGGGLGGADPEPPEMVIYPRLKRVALRPARRAGAGGFRVCWLPSGREVPLAGVQHKRVALHHGGGAEVRGEDPCAFTIDYEDRVRLVLVDCPQHRHDVGPSVTDPVGKGEGEELLPPQVRTRKDREAAALRAHHLNECQDLRGHVRGLLAPAFGQPFEDVPDPVLEANHVGGLDSLVFQFGGIDVQAHREHIVAVGLNQTDEIMRHNHASFSRRLQGRRRSPRW